MNEFVECRGDKVQQEDLELTVSSSLPWEKLTGKTVFITGATGLVGSQLVKTLLACNRNQNAINPSMLDCDYYRFLDGDVSAIEEFNDEYMVDYSWAEPTVATLMHKKNKFVQ